VLSGNPDFGQPINKLLLIVSLTYFLVGLTLLSFSASANIAAELQAAVFAPE
jgi:hypothetical protein